MRKRRTYSPEFKEEAIRLVQEEGISCAEAEKDLGIGTSLISWWIREKENLKGDAFSGSGNVRPSERENKNLEKELRRTKRELEILKKAVAIFSKEPNRYTDS